MAKLTIEVPAEEFTKAITNAYNKQKSKFSVPGFRKGKAPMSIIERTYGSSIFYEDTFNEIVPEIYEKELKENNIEAVSRPEIEITQMEKGKDLIFTAIVQTKPEVKLGKYKGIETVQLYLQDVVSSITRPLIELCGIRQVELAPKEEKIVEFILFTEDLSFYSHEKVFITEPGEFKLFAGNSSDNLRATSFELLETRISSNK